MASDGAIPVQSSELAPCLSVVPATLTFSLVLHTEIFLSLTLINQSTTQSIAFKIKTTARDRYLLKPTSDVILPGQSIDCKIVVSPIDRWPDVNQPKSTKDKFLIQSVPLIIQTNNQTISDLTAFWREREAKHQPKKGQFAYHEMRVKCKMMLPEDVDPNNQSINQTNNQTNNESNNHLINQPNNQLNLSTSHSNPSTSVVHHTNNSSNNQSTNQSINQSQTTSPTTFTTNIDTPPRTNNQTNNLSIPFHQTNTSGNNQSSNQSNSQPNNQSINQSNSQQNQHSRAASNVSVGLDTSRLSTGSINQSNQSFGRQSSSPSINQSTNQSTNQSNNQSNNQSINESDEKLKRDHSDLMDFVVRLTAQMEHEKHDSALLADKYQKALQSINQLNKKIAQLTLQQQLLTQSSKTEVIDEIKQSNNQSINQSVNPSINESVRNNSGGLNWQFYQLILIACIAFIAGRILSR